MEYTQIKSTKRLRELIRQNVPIFYCKDLVGEPEEKKGVGLNRGRKRATPEFLREAKKEIARYQTITEAAKGAPREYNALRYAGEYEAMRDFFRSKKLMDYKHPDFDIVVEADLKTFSTLAEYKKYRPKWYAYVLKEYPFMLEYFESKGMKKETSTTDNEPKF